MNNEFQLKIIETYQELSRFQCIDFVKKPTSSMCYKFLMILKYQIKIVYLIKCLEI